MNLIAEFQGLNYLAITIATVATYLLGFVWYHWAVFGQAWANSLGYTKDEADNTEGLGGAFVMSLLSGLLKTVCVAWLMAVINLTSILSGAMFGFVMAIAFILTSLGYYNGFARTPSKLTFINAAHGVVELVVIGAIIGAFN